MSPRQRHLRNESEHRNQSPTTAHGWLVSPPTRPLPASTSLANTARCALWCETNRQQLSRRRFVNWLNRCDRPMAGSASQRGQLASDTGMEELKKRFDGTF
jgi:hypothetical protein